MTLQGFTLGMIFVAVLFVVIWALGNVGLENHKRANTEQSDKED